MSQLVKTKRQANFKDFKRLGAFNGLVEQKNVVFNSFVCKLGLFWHAWAILKCEFLLQYNNSCLYKDTARTLLKIDVTSNENVLHNKFENTLSFKSCW
jgi:hypothetical protein